jgi:hypothetical protein
MYQTLSAVHKYARKLKTYGTSGTLLTPCKRVTKGCIRKCTDIYALFGGFRRTYLEEKERRKQLLYNTCMNKGNGYFF